MSVRIGIRREDKSVWERRVPIVPNQVRAFAKDGLDIVIQPSEIRIFPDGDYREAGAVISEDLTGCQVVFAVKEIPSSVFRPGGTYVFFSHVIKGQKKNMPMLKRMMELGCNLIDYERVVDEKNRRLIFFGWHAGVAGMIESLVAFGRRLDSEGIPNPFVALGPPHGYDSIREIKSVMEVLNHWTRIEGLPDEIVPLKVGFAGYGNVSRGAQEMLDILPTRSIRPSDLERITAEADGAKHTIFKVVYKEEDMVTPKKPGDAFALQDYYDHPEKYTGVFESHLPHLSILVNCIYWDKRYPRLVTKEYLNTRWTGSPLRVIGDISCDLDGAVEATSRITDPGSPAFVYDVGTGATVDGCAGNGPVIVAVDILPSELPRDASMYFSNALKEFIPAIARADYSVPFAKLALPEPIKRAVILHQGALSPDYEYISEFLE